MTTLFTKSLKTLALCLTLVGMMAFSQGTAKADEVTVSGSTTGTVTGVSQLTFAGNTFTGTTALGVGSLSGANRLGTFTLGTSATPVAANGTFSLNVTFTSPQGISGGQGRTFTATITGSVAATNNGGVAVTFNQPAGGTVFTFTNGQTTGTFTLLIEDVFIQSGQTANLTARITGAQQTGAIPEPATMLLLGTGLAGVAARIRRRKTEE